MYIRINLYLYQYLLYIYTHIRVLRISHVTWTYDSRSYELEQLAISDDMNPFPIRIEFRCNTHVWSSFFFFLHLLRLRVRFGHWA
jgi:hypothetical protein